jgi:hypothetical protein
MAKDTKGSAQAAQPLDEAWWTCDSPHSFRPQDVPDNVPILAPYEKTHPGFELVVAAACEPRLCGGHFEDVGNGYFQVCLWNIWHDCKNKWADKSDPADVDEEKRAINEMQRSLGPLDTDTRFVRIQIACFVRCWWDFPANLDLILDGIAKGCPNLDAPISCEPPWRNSILPLLRQRRGHPEAPAAPQQTAGIDHRPRALRDRLARAYLTILTWWMFDGDLDCLKREVPEHMDLAETIYRRLGRSSKLKALYVEKLRVTIALDAFPGRVDSAFTTEACRHLMEILDAAIRQELGDRENLIGRRIRLEALCGCDHLLFPRIDSLIASIGVGEVVRLPGGDEERRRTCREVTDYGHALGSWLARRTPEEAAEIWPLGKDTVGRVWDVLGEATSVKRWLAACLWKKLLDSQARNTPLAEDPERFALPPEALNA